MQQSSLIRFCDECGAANQLTATQCVACHEPLALSSNASQFTSIAPVKIASPIKREVIAGAAGPTTSPGLPVTLLPGTMLFGRYQILREIGRGGFSVVYMAQEMTGQRRAVAIKRIYLSDLTQRQIIDATETCNREIQMLTRLRSVEGVPNLYESFTDAENWYVIMQYIGGQTLEDYMQQAPGGYLPESKVVQIGMKLAQILQNLHYSGNAPGSSLIYRDIKPANIILTPKEELFLIDFGIARFFTPGQKKDTTPLGSPGYAPPEQYGRAQTDGRSDIYSLGVTLQTLLTGRDPLELTAGEPSRNPHRVSRQMRKLLNTMMDPDMSKRPQTILKVKQQLRWVQGFGSGDWPRSLLSLGVGFVAGLALGLTIWLITSTNFQFWWLSWVIWIAGTQYRKKRRSSLQQFYSFFLVLGLILAILTGTVLLLLLGLMPFQR